MIKRRQISVLFDGPKWPAHLFGRRLLLLFVADDYVALAAESRRDALEAALFAYLGRAVDVLDVEDGAKTEDEELGESGHQLRAGHQHINAVGPLLDHVERLQRQREPVVGELLDLVPNVQPLVAFVRAEQIVDTVAVRVVDLFDAAVAEGQLAHPFDAAANARRQRQVGVARVDVAVVEAVGGEIVCGQVLAVVVGRHVVNVNLITLLFYIKSEKKLKDCLS